MDAPKLVPQAEVISRIKVDIAEVTASLEELMPELGHSEAKRLFMAATLYPIEHTNMEGEKDAMRRAYGYSKNVKDALVALGVEVVIEQMLRQQQEQNNGSTETDSAPVSLEADKVEQFNESLYSLITESGWEDVKLEQETKAAPKKRAKKEKA